MTLVGRKIRIIQVSISGEREERGGTGESGVVILRSSGPADCSAAQGEGRCGGRSRISCHHEQFYETLAFMGPANKVEIKVEESPPRFLRKVYRVLVLWSIRGLHG